MGVDLQELLRAWQQQASIVFTRTGHFGVLSHGEEGNSQQHYSMVMVTSLRLVAMTEIFSQMKGG